jgi:hypothetical protein
MWKLTLKMEDRVSSKNRIILYKMLMSITLISIILILSLSMETLINYLCLLINNMLEQEGAVMGNSFRRLLNNWQMLRTNWDSHRIYHLNKNHWSSKDREVWSKKDKIVQELETHQVSNKKLKWIASNAIWTTN